ncbi:MAG TPA: MATE family efflux transporter [Candidatus Alistipes intestinipullorum]|nr:MATE family efflux transporter [Candidatus Alistipes intestinipullorum]
MERDALDLGSLRVGTLFRKLFVPTLLGMVSMSAVAVVDGIFVGHGVGSDGIAAVNICIPLLMIFTGIGLMAGVGSSVVSSIHFARGQVKAARINVTQALLFVTLVTLLPVTVILAFPRLTALLLGSSEHLLPLVVDYLIWFVPGLIPQLWIAVGLFVVRLDGAPRLAMWCSVLSALVNVLLDWLFIFPLGWGVMGAAFASTISIATGGVIVVRYLTHGARTLRLYRLKWSRKSFRLTFRNIGYQCRIGSSALLGEMTMAVLLFTGNQVFMRYLGDAGVGAFGITCYYMPFIFMIGNAVAQSAQPIISYSFGRMEWPRVIEARRIALLTALACGCLVAACFIAVPRLLVALFVDPADPAAQIAIDGFPLFAPGCIFFVVNLAAIGYFQSLERLAPATLFALLRGLVLLVPSFVFLPQLLGVSGIWFAMPLSECLTFLSIVGYVAMRRRRCAGR